jgi:endonuclease/exonuclease/phosphatase family metal-dependent hydrolase
MFHMAQEAHRVARTLCRARQRDSGLVRVASYNIHGCTGADGRYDPERVAQVIRELGCDIIGLQEVVVEPGLLTDSLQLEFLAATSAMTAVLSPFQIGSNRQLGNALLTKREVLSVQHHDLTVKGYSPRGALEVGLRSGAGMLRVIVTQLGSRPRERSFQIKRLLTLLRAIPAGQPVLLLADGHHWLPLGRSLRWRWLDRVFANPPTKRACPVWAPFVPMDCVWARAPAAVLTLETHRSGSAGRVFKGLLVKATVVANTRTRSSAWA